MILHCSQGMMQAILTIATVVGLVAATLNSIVVQTALTKMPIVRSGGRMASCSACSGFHNVEPMHHIPTCLKVGWPGLERHSAMQDRQSAMQDVGPATQLETSGAGIMMRVDSTS